MSKAEVREARRAWLRAKEHVEELHDDLARAEKEVERAHTENEQWEAHAELARTLHRLELAEDAVKIARRVLANLLEDEGCLPTPGAQRANAK